MKRYIVTILILVFIKIFSISNQSPIVFNVDKTVKNNSITITFKIYNREADDELKIIIINNKNDVLYSHKNNFISGDIGNINKKEQYQIIIKNQNFKNFFPILLCYDGNSYGTEMIVLNKSKEFTEYISKYEMTNIQYNEFVEIGNYSEEEYWHIYDKAITLKDLAWRYCTKYQWQCPKFWDLGEDPYYKSDPASHLKCSPVVGITWWEALAYIKWMDGEIITRDDWAKLVLNKEKFPQNRVEFIDLQVCKPPIFTMANLRFSNGDYSYDGFTKDGYKFTAPVGSFPPIIYKGQKIYDLIGNVFEWTKDVVKIIQYPEFTCAERYIIGGSYKSNIQQMTYPIIGLCPLYRTEAIGFRYKIKVYKKK